MLLRPLLSCSLVLVVASVLGQGCGGVVAPGTGGDAGASSGGGSGGSSSGGSSSGGGSTGGGSGGSSGGVTDASVTLDARPVPDSSIGPCQPDGVPCFSASQCCSGLCTASACGGPTPPPCIPDGASCQGSGQCCSGLCSGNVCTQSTVVCALPANSNQCDVCMASACCPQLTACENVASCVQILTCFNACYTGPGSGAACAQKCYGANPSPQATALEQCGINGCLSSCQ